MGICNSKSPTETCISPNNPNPVKDNANPVKDITEPPDNAQTLETQQQQKQVEVEAVKKFPLFPFYSPSPAHHLFSKISPPISPANHSSTTPRRFFKRSQSPVKHIREVLVRRQGSMKLNNAASASVEGGDKEAGEGGSGRLELDKSFGYSKNFENKYEIGEEIGRGHFAYTCKAKSTNGELKGQEVAVKVIPKATV